jgi:hypothetical protein
MKQGLGLLVLAVVLVAVSLWMGGSSDESIAGNAGATAIAACVAGIVGAVMVARSRMRD